MAGEGEGVVSLSEISQLQSFEAGGDVDGRLDLHTTEVQISQTLTFLSFHLSFVMLSEPLLL